MAYGKSDLPDDLLSSKTSCETWERNLEDKGLTGLLEDTKDQAISESNIPLSPQWLYAKPSDSKRLSSGTSGDIRTSSLLPNKTSGDLNPKDSWRLDGSQDKKDRTRTAPDLESSRRVKRREKQAYLAEEIAEKKTAVLMFHRKGMLLKIGPWRLQSDDMMLAVVIQAMNLEVTTSGLQDGVLKTKKTILELKRGQMLRRKMPLLTN
ncbi:uncharacterized protein LOC120140277 isoform X2 [Hibiscus syriacus]|uniref:uncharacterized protein LOC120140277 isoform X2 n=1 Tax=Hibiscus syriacus TaxID=106335 RepID=UPI0019217031|nr:uncharacterized protein LOC120140277 isoform X2 [Hibiscus syriacus]